jgi:hypothetical protein
MTLPSSVALAFVLTTGAGVVMMMRGLSQRALVRRRRDRCPSCGRFRGPRGCRCD